MTAQVRNHETLHKSTANPDFMVRWLNGDLTESELASLRNRTEYEEMVAASQADAAILPEKKAGQVVPVFPKKENEAVAKTANTNAFATFVAVAIVALLATLYFVKSSGWF